MSDKKKVMKHVKKRIDKYAAKDKQVTITNDLNYTLSNFYQEDDGTVEATSNSLVIKDEDVTYEIFNNGIVLKIEDKTKEPYGATHNKPHCTPN